MDRAEERMTPEKMKLIAKRLFIAGFFFLPFLWLVNAFFFRRYYKHPATPEVVNRYVRLSVGAFVAVQVAWLAWLVLFQTQRDAWTSFGDFITVYIPTA